MSGLHPCTYPYTPDWHLTPRAPTLYSALSPAPNPCTPTLQSKPCDSTPALHVCIPPCTPPQHIPTTHPSMSPASPTLQPWSSSVPLTPVPTLYPSPLHSYPYTPCTPHSHTLTSLYFSLLYLHPYIQSPCTLNPYIPNHMPILIPHAHVPLILQPCSPYPCTLISLYPSLLNSIHVLIPLSLLYLSPLYPKPLHPHSCIPNPDLTLVPHMPVPLASPQNPTPALHPTPHSCAPTPHPCTSTLHPCC